MKQVKQFDHVEVKTVSTGSLKWSVTFRDGAQPKWAGTFDTNIGDILRACQSGEWISVELQKSGTSKYWNIMSVERIANQQPTSQPPATQPPATQPPATQPPATQPPAAQPPAQAPLPGTAVAPGPGQPGYVAPGLPPPPTKPEPGVDYSDCPPGFRGEKAVETGNMPTAQVLAVRIEAGHIAADLLSKTTDTVLASMEAWTQVYRHVTKHLLEG